MKYKYKLLSLVSVLILCLNVLVLPAKADGGLAIGIIGNMATFDTAGSETEGNVGNDNPATELASTTISKDVDFGSILVEYVAKAAWAGLTVGVEIIPGDAEIGAQSRTDTDGSDAAENDDGTYTAKAQVSDHMSLYVEPTIYAGDVFGLYVKGGVSRLTLRSLENLAVGGNSSSYGDKGVTGLLIGVGLRATHSSGIFMKLENMKTEYGSVQLQSSSGNKNTITADPEQENTRIAIGYQF